MPLFLLHKGPPLWGVWKIEESPEELLAQLTLCDLPQGVEEMRHSRRRQERLAVRVLLKELLGRETPIAYRANGAPYLRDNSFHISISHTRGFAAVILHRQSPVGIDMERLNPRILRVRSRFLHPEEEAGIDVRHETEHLLLHWCAKETLFKLIGLSGVDFREHLRVLPFRYQPQGKMKAAETRTPQGSIYMLGYMVNRYFAITWSLDMTVVKRPSLLNSAIMVLLFLIR
ncbi:MAG: 4'-phosphopantetheinyl transferase superfamily protein [Tannerellaceae bacterium]|jgi:phosphopantetheinyl transferase|nr:4'-phosphopantetheinyl transferase superfamily protein [Tannerellaceae bacterium]